jgi:DNA-binding response OmpR family regulator
MPSQLRAVAFDVDPDSLVSLAEALPGWDIQAIRGASPGSLAQDWDPGAAQLLVVGARDQPGEILGLCRGLRSQARRAHTSLLVLVPPAQQILVRAALEAGADSCLVLPVHPKELAALVARALERKRPGRHTLGLDRAQAEDPWQDDGGEA